MEWNDPLYAKSLSTGECAFCDNSYDSRPIFDHLLDVHPPNGGGQKIQSGTADNNNKPDPTCCPVTQP
jgi:hypothetical protein